MKETRNTFQKSVVFEMLRGMQDHPTADRVYERVKNQYPSISRSTVYRILNQLSQQGEVYKVQMPATADRFDYNKKPHYHAHCVKCGEVFDIPLERMNALERKASQISGFQIMSHSIIFEGICPQCREEQRQDG
ncbi:MAG: transcriptional repressor [Lachnospiraceae bacterium]|nr:transcriptional repressor [Lachnospiraceae bacterium]